MISVANAIEYRYLQNQTSYDYRAKILRYRRLLGTNINESYRWLNKYPTLSGRDDKVQNKENIIFCFLNFFGRTTYLLFYTKSFQVFLYPLHRSLINSTIYYPPETEYRDLIPRSPEQYSL